MLKRIALFSAFSLGLHAQAFPSAVATDADLPVAKNLAQTTLATTITSGSTSIVLADASLFASYQVITIGSERIKCGVLTVNTFASCTRGYDSSTAAAHTSGAAVNGYLVAGQINALNNEVKAIEGALGASLVNVQPRDADLTALAALSCSDGQISKKSSGVWTCAADDNSGGSGVTFVPTRTSSTILTFPAISAGAFSVNNTACPAVTTGATFTLSSGTGTAWVALDSGCNLVVRHSGVGACSGCTAYASASGFDPTDRMLYEWAFTSGSLAGSGTNRLTAYDSNPIVAGANIIISEVAGVKTIASPSIASEQKRLCEIHIWGTGALGVLQNTDDEAESCYNGYGATLTIAAVRCWADAGSPTVLPIINGGGTILTGALTCGTASMAAGTLSGTPTLSSAGAIDAVVTAAGGTATNIRIIVEFTL